MTAPVALLARLYPALPNYVRCEVMTRLAGRPLHDPARQLADMVEAVARHQFTDYDQLRAAHELTPEEARIVVAPEVKALLDDWRGNRSSG